MTPTDRTTLAVMAAHAVLLLCLAALPACNAIPTPPADGSTDDPPGSGTPPTAENQRPNATMGNDRELLVGEVVVFDAAGSRDPDGEIVTYRWEFGDGAAATGSSVDHVYTAPGRFDATLTVTDDRGAADTDSVVVTVLEAPPLSRFALTVNVEPPQAGTVTADPPGGVYEDGELVTLTAEPANGFEFVGFEGDATGAHGVIEILMDTDKEVVAVFDVADVEVTGMIDPPSAGMMLFDPPGGIYAPGTSVTVSASPFPGFTFDAFMDPGGDIISPEPMMSFQADTDRQIIARFRPVTSPSPVTLTVLIEPPHAGTVTLDPPSGSYAPGTVVTVIATPSPGYTFVGYSGDHTGVETVAEITMNGDKTVMAEFAWAPAMGNPRNLLVTGFLGKNVTEFDRFDGRYLGELVAEGSGGLSFAGGIDVGPDGDLFVVNVGVVNDTSVIRYDGMTGKSRGEFIPGPGAVGFTTLQFGPNGNLFVPDNDADAVEEYAGTTGAFVRTFVTAGSAGLQNPLGLVFAADGDLFLVSANTDSILEYDGATGDPLGTVVDLAAFGFTDPADLTFGPDGALYVTVSGDESVARVDVETGQTTSFVSSGSGGLDAPAGLRFHPDTGNLLVVSQETNSVLEYDGATGAFVGVFATGSAGDSLFFMTFRPE